MLERDVPAQADEEEIFVRVSEAQGIAIVWKPFIGGFIERLYATPFSDVGGTALTTTSDFTSRSLEDGSAIAPVVPEE